MAGIGILGAHGRMGRAIAAELAAAGDAPVGGCGRGDDPAALAARADVLIDVTHPTTLATHLAAATTTATPILIATTGLSDADHDAIDAAAAIVPVLQTGNTSLGVTLLAALVREAAARLGDDWDIEIVEMHHRHKVDAPSGTALLLGAAAAAGRSVSLADVAARDRAGPRAPGSIGLASLRGGSVVGDHSVVFAGEGERIELAHRADTRAIFARGAIRAARWLVGRTPGRYTMAQVLDL